jgi:hypothetical protein
MKLKIQKIALVTCLSFPLLGLAAPHGQANADAKLIDSEHQANMANIVNRNQDNVAADPTTALPDWFKKITISGVLDPSANFGFGNRPFPVPSNSRSSGGPSQSLTLNAAELYIDAQVADWVLAHTTFAYDTNFNDASNYEPGSSNYNGSAQPQTLFVEEAAVTLANFQRSPFWLTAGRQFLLFGSYSHDAVSKPLTQFLSEANNVAVTLGGIQPIGSANVYGDIYTFQGVSNNYQTVSTQTIHGVGGNVGINQTINDLSYNFNVGVLNDLMNAYFVGNACNPNLGVSGTALCRPGSTKQVPGLSLHFDADSGPFGVKADFVTALVKFSGLDLPSGANPIAVTSPGAQPWAMALEAIYRFPSVMMNKTYDSRAYVTYQQSGDAVNVSSATVLGGFWMPQYRYAVGYGIDLVKNVRVRLQYQYDIDYSVANGGTGLNNNVLLADLKVLF